MSKLKNLQTQSEERWIMRCGLFFRSSMNLYFRLIPNINWFFLFSLSWAAENRWGQGRCVGCSIWFFNAISVKIGLLAIKINFSEKFNSRNVWERLETFKTLKILKKSLRSFFNPPKHPPLFLPTFFSSARWKKNRNL